MHLLRYIRDNKILGLKYYADMKDAPLYDLLRQVNIKTENQLISLSDTSSQYCPYTERSTGAYTIFYQGGPIDYETHVPSPVAKSSSESEYNAACTSGTDLANSRMLIHELLKKDK